MVLQSEIIAHNGEQLLKQCGFHKYQTMLALFAKVALTWNENVSGSTFFGTLVLKFALIFLKI